MEIFLGDLHIHSVLSPCGDPDMSPSGIVDESVRTGLDLIAVTDHNHLGHVRLVSELGRRKGLWVVYGVEITTREEVHCLAFFDTDDQVRMFQNLMEERLPKLAHDPDLFRHQIIMDEKDQIREQVGYSLYPGLT